MPEYDIFSTSIVTSYDVPLSTHEHLAAKTVALAHKYKKVPQRWIMSYFESPKDMDFIGQIACAYAKAGSESIFSWTCRAGEGTILSAPDPGRAWDAIGSAFRDALAK